MKKQIIAIVTIILGMNIALVACQNKVSPKVNSNYSLKINDTFIEDDYYNEYEKKCYEFVKSNLISSQGGLFTNYIQSEGIKSYAKGHEVLSESQGLYMLYLVQKGYQKQFNECKDFIMKYMLTSDGTILWRTDDKNSDIAQGNAAVDDLRIMRAFLEAYEKWNNPEYKIILKKLEKSFYQKNVKENALYDYYDIREKKTRTEIPLCYMDLKTMQLLSEDRKEWLDVTENALKIIQKGYLGSNFPFYQGAYEYSTKKYNQLKTIPMTEAVLTVLHLAEVGKHKSETIEWLKENLKKGALYGTYDLGGIAVTNIESTAIYATVAQIGKIIGDIELYTLAIENMLRFQVNDGNTKINGAFGNKKTEEIYSYDNLQALLAF